MSSMNLTPPISWDSITLRCTREDTDCLLTPRMRAVWLTLWYDMSEVLHRALHLSIGYGEKLGILGKNRTGAHAFLRTPRISGRLRALHMADGHLRPIPRAEHFVCLVGQKKGRPREVAPLRGWHGLHLARSVGGIPLRLSTAPE